MLSHFQGKSVRVFLPVQNRVFSVFFYPRFLSFEGILCESPALVTSRPEESRGSCLAPALRGWERGLFSTDTSSGTGIMLHDHS